MRLLTVAVLFVLGVSTGRAAAEDLSCRNGEFPASRHTFGLAKVIGVGPLHLLDDSDGCPSEDARCRGRAYVVPGDELLTERDHSAYVCAFFANRVGGDAGWAPRDRLASLPVDVSPPLAAWIGHWAEGDDTIALTAKNGALVVDGSAYWPSAHPSRSEAPGGPNEGDLSGTAKPAGDRAVFSDGDPDGCTATLTLIGALLVVADNDRCGGMNVSFTGVYRRR